MSDTRTIYLKNNSGTIYSSDPSNVGYEYLDMSGFDSLNPSENSIFTSATNISLMYGSYDVKIVLTFISDYDNGRQARADWIAKNQNNITQISVANTNNLDLIFSKQAKIKTIDFIENPYVNGVQAELTLELAGRWQSSIQRTSATVYPYTGGTKKYTYHYSTLDRSLLLNRNLYTDTKNFDNLASWRGSSVWTKTTDSYNGLAVMQTTQDWNGLSQYIQVKKGDILTYSVYAKNISGTGTSIIYWALNNDHEGSYRTAAINPNDNAVTITDSWQRISVTTVVTSEGYLRPRLERTNDNTNTLQIAGIKVEKGNIATDWTPAPEDTNPQPTYKYGYQVITDEVVTSGYNGFIINIPSQTTPINVTLTAPSGLSVTLTTSQVNVPLQISSDMIGYSLDNFDNFTLLNKGFPASKYWDNLLSVYSTIQTILNANKVTVSVASSNGSSIPFEFYLYKLQDLI